MKRENYYKFLYGICGVLAVAFCIYSLSHYSDYRAWALPMYWYFVGDVLLFLLPCAVVFAIARSVKRKYNGKH